MKTARTSDRVIWWRMGVTSRTKHGRDRALEMAEQIISAGTRQLYLDGVEGRPRPRVRPITTGAPR